MNKLATIVTGTAVVAAGLAAGTGLASAASHPQPSGRAVVSDAGRAAPLGRAGRADGRAAITFAASVTPPRCVKHGDTWVC